MNNKPHILITGANGQLGMCFRELAANNSQFQFTFLSRTELPVENLEFIENLFKQQAFNFCINCAAYTAVDKAESDTENAFLINAYAVGNLAAICKKYQIQFIHFSTDYVFDGMDNSPIKENAITNPQNVYGASKLKGEVLCLQNNPAAIIIRTSWVYSAYGHNFVKTMLRLMKEKESVSVVDDQVGIPTSALDLALAVLKLIQKAGSQNAGIYHFSNTGIPVSWYQFALAIKEFSGSKCLVKPVPSTQYPTPAKRPAYSVLETTLIRKTFEIEIPNWKESLKKTVEKLTV